MSKEVLSVKINDVELESSVSVGALEGYLKANGLVGRDKILSMLGVLAAQVVGYHDSVVLAQMSGGMNGSKESKD